MKSCDTVHCKRADDRKISHTDHLFAAFLNERHTSQASGISRPLEGNLCKEASVDFVNDLEMTRQEFLKESDRPLFQSFGHERVVRVSKGTRHDVPSFVPFQAFVVQKNAHQFRNGNRRVRIVQLDGDLVREKLPFAVMQLFETADNVLQGSGAKEILLAQAQDFSVHGGIVRVQDLRNRFRKFHILDCGQVVAIIKIGKSEFVGTLRTPKTEVVHRVIAVAGNRRVIRQSQHVILRFPTVAKLAFVVRPGHHIAAERHLNRIRRTRDFPRIRETEPIVRQFFLLAVFDFLVEHAVFIANAHTRRREFQSRHRIEEASGQAAKSAVAKPRVHFFFAKFFKGHAQFGNRFFHSAFHIQIQNGIAQGAANQKFQRQVVNALDVLFVIGFLRLDPAIDQAVAHSICHGQKFFVFCHRVFITGKRMVNVIIKSVLESLDSIFQNFGMFLGRFFFCHKSPLQSFKFSPKIENFLKCRLQNGICAVNRATTAFGSLCID